MFGRERHVTHGHHINKPQVEPELHWERATAHHPNARRARRENTSNVSTEPTLTFSLAAKSRPPRCKDTNDLIQDKHKAGRWRRRFIRLRDGLNSMPVFSEAKYPEYCLVASCANGIPTSEGVGY